VRRVRVLVQVLNILRESGGKAGWAERDNIIITPERGYVTVPTAAEVGLSAPCPTTTTGEHGDVA
jgi:hypothetical protein